MTRLLFREDAYLRTAQATVAGHTEEGGILVDASVFYPTSGGQPGDSGLITWDDGQLEIATAVKGPGETVILVPAEPSRLPKVGAEIVQEINWERRHKLMRMHTALHLLSVVIPLPVTGGSIGTDRGRLDFDMPSAPENKDELENTLNRLIDCHFAVNAEWISQGELDANPSLVKTMSVAPPRGVGKVRLVRIGTGENTADLQPCGGTHVANTDEIGPVKLGKIEKKGRQNRRVQVLFA